jgi:type VII secretion protein EccB
VAANRDRAQAQRHLGGRVVSALVTGQSDPEQPPFRRSTGAAFGSVVIGALLLVGFGVYGLVVPGGNRSWQQGDAVIVVKETGTRYVYVDHLLHPVANYASALLALGKFAPTRTVSRASLVGVPRGPAVGIADAPDALPGASGLLRGGWTLCSRPAESSTGTPVEASALLVGTELTGNPTGGHPLADAAVLAQVRSTGEQYLLWHGYRHPIPAAEAATVGVALRVGTPTPVDPALIDVLPAGAPIGPLGLADAGAPSNAVPGRAGLRVGQLVVVRTADGGTDHYLVTANRLRPVSALQYDIQLASRAAATAYAGGEPAGIELSAAAAAGAMLDPPDATAAGAAPPRRPDFAATSGDRVPVCATFAPGADVPQVRLDPPLPAAAAMVPTSGQTAGGLPLADRVYVPPGHAALAEARPSARSAAGTLVLVTDQGRGYPLAGPEVLAMLGYPGAEPVPLPAGLVTRVPLGRSLDPADVVPS